MATIKEVIARVDAMRENKFTAQQKSLWLLALEGQLFETLVQNHEQGVGEYPKKFPEDGDMPMLIPEPWDEVYDLYLIYRMDLARRDPEFQNSYMAYAVALREVRQWYHRTHMPRSRGGTT